MKGKIRNMETLQEQMFYYGERVLDIPLTAIYVGVTQTYDYEEMSINPSTRKEV